MSDPQPDLPPPPPRRLPGALWFLLALALLVAGLVTWRAWDQREGGPSEGADLSNEGLDARLLQAEAGISWAWYRAGLEHVNLGAQFDPAFAFAQRFAPGRMARLWFSGRLREAAPRLPAAEGALSQLSAEQAPERDVAQRTFELLDCATAGCAPKFTCSRPARYQAQLIPASACSAATCGASQGCACSSLKTG